LRSSFSSFQGIDESTHKSEKADVAKESLPSQRGVFSWHHLNYDVPISGGKTRRLLDDVSGFVTPGKLVRFMVFVWGLADVRL